MKRICLLLCTGMILCGYPHAPLWGADVDAPLPAGKLDARALKDNKLLSQVLVAIEKGQAFLLSQQKDNGSWKAEGRYTVGPSILCALALVKSGISNKNPAVVKCVEWIEKESRLPPHTYETTSLIMLLESYGKIFKEGEEPEGPPIYRRHTQKKKSKSRRRKKKVKKSFDPEIRKWMEALTKHLVLSGGYGAPRMKIPEPKTKEEVAKRLAEIEGEQKRAAGERVKKKDMAKLYRKTKSKVKYKLTPSKDFEVYRFRYQTDGKRTDYRVHNWDTSNLQYVYLALKASLRVGIKVDDPKVWYGSLIHWLEYQEKEGPEVDTWRLVDEKARTRENDPYYTKSTKGTTFQKHGTAHARGWGYRNDARDKLPDGQKDKLPPAGSDYYIPQARHTLTPAGISSLLLIRSVLYKDEDYLAYFEDLTEKAITDGMAWLDVNWKWYVANVSQYRWGFYAHYGIERVGVFAGTEVIGKHFWYRELAEHLLAHQKENGSWSGVHGKHADAIDLEDTSWALLVLARGSEPMPEVPKPKASYTVSTQ